mmetsp:Transcript_11362/g.28751  ORF Transcript_11362/g.28751 Transcript_11362/m.28751 type:complete len:181 (-) Transcript_11362:351-893(-)
MIKVDVEGFEGSVISGAYQFIADAEIPIIQLEFGQRSGCPVTADGALVKSFAMDPWEKKVGIVSTPEGSMMTARGVQLLDFVHDLGYTCYHFRGFGDCEGFEKKNDLRCMWPAKFGDDPDSVSFLHYSKQFAYDVGGRGLSDLICLLNRTSTNIHPFPKPIPSSGNYAHPKNRLPIKGSA